MLLELRFDDVTFYFVLFTATPGQKQMANHKFNIVLMIMIPEWDTTYNEATILQ
jgi:hypothetical protein